jgi:hypothetical protein
MQELGTTKTEVARGKNTSICPTKAASPQSHLHTTPKSVLIVTILAQKTQFLINKCKNNTLPTTIFVISLRNH